MDRTGIEKALRNAVNCSPEIPFDQIAAQPFIRMQEHDFITRQQQIKRVSPIRQLSLATAMCLIIILTVSGWYVRNRAVDSVITLDVNPSIEILTNRKEEILSVKAMNADAQRLIGNRDYSHTGLNDTVSMLIKSLVEKEYVNRERNAILLTVTNKNSRKADDLLKKMDTAIRENLTAKNIEPLILSKTITAQKADDKVAANYNISRGKLQLIRDMIDFNHNLSLEKLAKLSVEQLLILANENHMDLRKYLEINGKKGMPSVTEKPDHNKVKSKNKTSNGANVKSEQKDSNDIKNRADQEEIDKKDDSNIQKQEDRDNGTEGEHKEGKKKNQNGKSKNIEKEDAEVKERDRDPENTENKNTLTNPDEDDSDLIKNKKNNSMQ